MIQLFGLFVYTFCLALLLPIFLPSLHLIFFAPFLVLCFYRCSLLNCLWWSLSCGFIIDLLSTQTRLGIYATIYCLVTIFLYRYKFYFFEDRLSTLPVMTFGFTCLSTLIQTALFYAIGQPFFLSWEWMITDLIFIPLQNAFYAGFAFILPPWVLSSLRKPSSSFRRSKRKKT